MFTETTLIKRMFSLAAWAVSKNVATSEKDFLVQIGFPYSNYSNVKSGRQSFSKEHIFNACKLTGASADYLLGLSTTMFAKESRDPLEMIKQAVKSLEDKKEIKSKKLKLSGIEISHEN
jgi:hypothetical protein